MPGTVLSAVYAVMSSTDTLMDLSLNNDWHKLNMHYVISQYFFLVQELDKTL